MRLLDPRAYTVLWIAPLEIEARAAKLFLDHHHPGVFESDDSDDHVFYAGDICGYNVIIGSFPTGQVYGISSATSLVKEARSRFPELKFGLLVGVAAGIPQLDKPPLRDIRLGDVLVAVPDKLDPAIIPYELGKDVDGGQLQLLRCGYSLNEVPKLFRGGIGNIKDEDAEITVRFYREAMEQQLPDHTFDDPGQDKDPRFRSENSNGQDLRLGQSSSAAARTQVWQTRPNDPSISDTVRGTKRRFSQLSIANGAQLSGNVDGELSTDDVPHESRTLERRRALLDSLEFDQLYTHQEEIREALNKTCAGKSTLMKFLLTNAKKRMASATLISFFFKARGVDLQRTTIGMYRSLLWQLLQQLPQLQTVLDPFLVKGQSGISSEWKISLLQSIFRKAILCLGTSHLVCFIDALDECEEVQIRDMLSFFEDIGDFAAEQNIQFRVCLSSRYYPHITISKGLGIDLREQNGHTQDIERYVKSKLKIGSGRTANTVYSDVVKKAKGVFMWVFLVVPILQQVYDRGCMSELREQLAKIPRDLHELFRNILTRDRENQDRQLLCIQWVLFAKQPLRPTQLHLAILFGTLPDCSKLPLGDINPENSRRFILSCSKGLTELTRSSKNQTVQFIHESVRDFLLKDKGLEELWIGATERFQGECHEKLKQFCLDYMNSATQFCVDKPLLGNAKQKLKVAQDAANRDFPCLEYAVTSLLHHADCAQDGGVCQVNFMESFPLQRWIELSNAFERYGSRKYDFMPSLLYVLAEQNAGNLINVHPDRALGLRAERRRWKPASWTWQYRYSGRHGRYGVPLLAALATGSCDSAAALMKVLAQNADAAVLIQEICQAYGKNASQTPAIRRGFDYHRKWHQSLMEHLINAGDTMVLDFLLTCGQNDALVLAFLLTPADGATPSGLSECRPLHSAAWGDHAAALRPVLKRGAHLNQVDLEGRTALSVAVKLSREEVVIYLLEAGANVEIADNLGRTPLHVAAKEGNIAMVRLLLHAGADVNTACKDGDTPLLCAVVRSLAIVRALLDKNANVDIADRKGRTPLSLAITQGGTLDDVIMPISVAEVERREIVWELVARGADIHARDAQAILLDSALGVIIIA
ncbi:hypothetical protein LMH87_007526 [Akanthomyces muscarius]|uniref:Nephrocystin 3-like N-terminal domain-containing protein n=1 Tax=Akanthomyces muscarius TaxID=2231603 RepID=A0A9W8UU43_AKAMU|nr:hypothetical protein LMH87_007526 [Akanthomyces muscarius]KAJ4165923.1 hypothetical protein LMH87_007526 [Akanthomyces muscarius]